MKNNKQNTNLDKAQKNCSPNIPSNIDHVPLAEVHINPEEIPQEVYDTACRILKTSVRRFFEQPGVQEDYEKWLNTPEGIRAAQHNAGRSIKPKK